MLFYHYSEHEFPELKSLLAQGRQDNSSQVERDSGFFDKVKINFDQVLRRLGMRDEYSYDRHVSLFLEPIPLDLAKIFKGQHKYWRSGLELFEYTIHLDDLPKDIRFIMEETPDKTRLLYEVQDWGSAKTNPSLVLKFKAEVIELQQENGYIGYGVNALVKVCRHFNKGIRHYYQLSENLAKRFPEDGIQAKYAACVPHLMVYPGYRSIKISETKKVVLM